MPTQRLIPQLDLPPVHAPYARQGGFPYPPHLMLGLLLHGLMDGVRSSRQLQQHCQYDLRYIC